MEASKTARRLYHQSQELGPDAEETVAIRRWIHDIYMTILLRRFIEMKATDTDILAMIGGTRLDDSQLEFIRQTRAAMQP